MDYLGYIPPQIKLYIFDLDGTLVDSLPDMHYAIGIMLNRYGLPQVLPDVVRRGIGNGVRNLLFRCFAVAAREAGKQCPDVVARTDFMQNGGTLTWDGGIDRYPEFSKFIIVVLEEYRKVYLDNCVLHTAFYPGIETWLNALAGSGCFLTLLSNKPLDASKKILQFLGVHQLFGIIAGPESVGVMKPDPLGIRQIMAQTGFLPSQTVMIGDSVVDIETGRNAKVMVCGITGGYGNDGDVRNGACDILIER